VTGPVSDSFVFSDYPSHFVTYSLNAQTPPGAAFTVAFTQLGFHAAVVRTGGLAGDVALNSVSGFYEATFYPTLAPRPVTTQWKFQVIVREFASDLARPRPN
jgi:hypothetical protein